MKLFLENYLLLILLNLLTLFSCVEKSTTDSNKPSTIPPAPSLAIDYDISKNFYIALTNTALALIQKTDFGSQSNFYVNPSLPSGLSLDITNGNIKGSPTTISLPTTYTITAIANSKTYTNIISLGVAPTQVWVTNTNSLNLYQLTAYVVGDGAKQIDDWIWSSDNPSLTTVSNGMVNFKATTNRRTVLISAVKDNYSNGMSLAVDKVEEVNGQKIITDGRNVRLSISSGTKTVADNQFNNKNLTSLVIPNSVSNIGLQAFSHNRLTSLVIPNGVISINAFSFQNNQLTSLVIPNSLTTIGFGAFGYNQLTSVIIGNSVTSIGGQAFQYNQLTSVIIGNSVKTIDKNAFRNNQLTNVVIPNSVTNISKYAFQYNRLTSVMIGNSVTSIGLQAFKNNLLASVIIGNSVKTIGNNAFQNNQLTNVVIPNSLTSIADATFEGNQLTSVIIPDSVTSIDNNAFTSNPNLVEVSLKQSLYTKITTTSSTNAVFGRQVTNYIKR